MKEWLRSPNSCSICVCESASESIRHCLWDCMNAKSIWHRLLRIFQFQKIYITVSWGSVVWMSLCHNVSKYDTLFGNTKAIKVSHGHVQSEQINHMWANLDNMRQTELWILLSSCTIWHIWKARCQRLFDNIIFQPIKVVLSIWQEMVATLRARYGGITGDSNSTILRRLAFHGL